MTHQEFVNKIGKESAKKLYALYDLGGENGLKVKVRTYPNVCGDFCIFIYDKSVKSSYMVGFDGCFDSQFKLTIDYCIDESMKWIKDYVSKKVEPKFKVGDWVVNKLGDIWHIDSFDAKNYQVSNVKGEYNYFPINKQDRMRLCTMDDAKETEEKG